MDSSECRDTAVINPSNADWPDSRNNTNSVRISKVGIDRSIVSLHYIIALLRAQILLGLDLLHDHRAGRHRNCPSRKYGRLSVPKHTSPAPTTRRLSDQRLRTSQCCVETHVSREHRAIGGNLIFMPFILGVSRLERTVSPSRSAVIRKRCGDFSLGRGRALTADILMQISTYGTISVIRGDNER
jgi:hypothetical protein